MTVVVMLGLLIGLVVGGAGMALWAAGRIGEEAARQFDRGFERGRWLADLSVSRALEPPQRGSKVRLLRSGGLAAGGLGRDGPGLPADPRSALLLPRAVRPGLPRTRSQGTMEDEIPPHDRRP